MFRVSCRFQEMRREEKPRQEEFLMDFFIELLFRCFAAGEDV